MTACTVRGTTAGNSMLNSPPEWMSEPMYMRMSLSPVTQPDADMALAADGATVFADNCTSCHMEDGTGDRSQGAPNLTDAIWLYGGSQEQVESSVRVGPFGVMPNWNTRLDDAEIKGYGERFLKRKEEERKLVEEKRADSLED